MEQRYRPRGQIQPKRAVHSDAPEEIRPSNGEPPATTPAADIKDLVSLLSDFTMDELRDIPVVRVGAQLEQGATYIDLTDDDRTQFKALGTMVAERDRYFVPKRETPTPYWNRLIGAQPPLRRQ